jgi:hypothetical protein
VSVNGGHPAGRPRAPVDHPAGRPRAPVDHPAGRPGAPVDYPAGRPRAPVDHPAGRPRASVDGARYLPGQRAGHYESFFLRANHPSRPLAFWIRYTLFSPEGRPEAAVGELWAIFFDGESGEHVAVKREVPIAQARFDRTKLDVRILDRGQDGGHDATLVPGALAGTITSGEHSISWDLRYSGGERPLLLFPEALYEARLPRAKSLVGVPLCTFQGALQVDGRAIQVGGQVGGQAEGWVGSQNHNWGSQHTDHYAWGQVAGFDDHPGSFLEIATARLRLGPVWTPFMTPAVLRHEGREHAANGPLSLARARGDFDYFTWRFAFETDEVRARGTITAEAGDFVGLAYANPPGGVKHCLNTKIAACSLTLTHKAGGRVETLSTRRRAAFEILTDDRAHGIAIRA